VTAYCPPARVRLLILLAAATSLAATTAWAQTSVQPLAAPPVDPLPNNASLAIGEPYAITAGRAQVFQRYEGGLVLANQNWIVLRCVSEGRRERAAPAVGFLPYIERHFKTAPSERQADFVWIPRSAVSKSERLATSAPVESAGVVQASAQEAPPGVAPRLGIDCSVNIVDAKQIASHQGKLARMAGGKLTLVCERLEVRERPLAGAKHVPIFGQLFTTEEVVKQSTIQTHSLDKLLSIRVPVPPFDAGVETPRK
jgi:hypothetical protein